MNGDAAPKPPEYYSCSIGVWGETPFKTVRRADTLITHYTFINHAFPLYYIKTKTATTFHRLNQIFMSMFMKVNKF